MADDDSKEEGQPMIAATVEVVIAGGKRVHLQPWRCPYCGMVLTMYAFMGGVLVLQRDKCPTCRKPLPPLIVEDVS